MDPEKSSVSASADTESPLSGMISAVLSNPDMMEKIKQMIGNVGMDASSRTTDAPTVGENPILAAENIGTTGAQPSLPVFSGLTGDGLATVLSNPELMARLPQMMAMLRPMMEGVGVVGGPKDLASAQGRKKSSEDYRNELLCALKPFLSPERQHAVDAMLRISQLGNVLRHIK